MRVLGGMRVTSSQLVNLNSHPLGRISEILGDIIGILQGECQGWYMSSYAQERTTHELSHSLHIFF